MITVISPAKKLSDKCNAVDVGFSQPSHLNRSDQLVSQLRSYDPTHLQDLMGISENLAILNWERIQNWNKTFKPINSREAVYSFMGDTYTGLDSDSLDNDDLVFAQKHTRILSGLYGVLRPMDLMMPYRLEMGTKLENRSGNNLYDYWGDTLAESINNELQEHKYNVVVNCASVEYFKSIDRPSLSAQVITPHFKEIKNGKTKMISFFAKKARGMMARFIIQNKIIDTKGILEFDSGGYVYDPSLSTPLDPVFTRPQA